MPAPQHSNVGRITPRESPREGLRRAHAARATLLEDKRREATHALAKELTDTARTLLKEAVAHRDDLLQKALASDTSRPPSLVEAERRVAHLTEELSFAQERLKQADAAVADAKREADATVALIRENARAVVANELTHWAERLARRMRDIDAQRAALHGAIVFCEGQGILLGETVHSTDMRQPPDFSTRNTPGEKTSSASAGAWRAAFDDLQKDPNAILPIDEEE